MAQAKKYKLGELEFETEQEYRDAATDLKRIQSLMSKYDVSDPQQAARILASIKAHPETFRSPYGRKFIEKLEAAVLKPAAGSSSGSALSGKSGSRFARTAKKDAAQAEKQAAKKNAAQAKQAAKKEKKQKKPKEKRVNTSRTDRMEREEKFQIFTVRNFTIGFIIIACVVVFSIFAPKLFSFNGSGDSNSDIRENLVIAYAKNQADLKEQLYTYYFSVVGETEEEAENDAKEGLGHYVMDLSDRTLSSMSDSEIKDIYSQLCDGGDIQNNSFVEPAEITVLREKLLAAGLSSNSGNGVEGETAVVAAINNMMDYQERLFYSLTNNYSKLNYQEEDCEKFAVEDMEAMFGAGEIIYNYKMEEEEKQKYFDSFTKKGLIKDNQVVRFSTDPTAYNMPELTPVIEVAMKGEKSKSYECSMISYAPAASVFYEIHAGKETGYICFRNNGKNSKYIPLDEETSVTAQGDFFMLTESGELYPGEWFYNKQDIGILINGDSSSKISMVHDLTY